MSQGRPYLLYNAPQMFGYQDQLVNVPENEIEICMEETIPKDLLPCDETVFELCHIFMEEHGWELPENPAEAATLYVSLRDCFLDEL